MNPLAAPAEIFDKLLNLSDLHLHNGRKKQVLQQNYTKCPTNFGPLTNESKINFLKRRRRKKRSRKRRGGDSGGGRGGGEGRQWKRF